MCICGYECLCMYTIFGVNVWMCDDVCIVFGVNMLIKFVDIRPYVGMYV